MRPKRTKISKKNLVNCGVPSRLHDLYLEDLEVEDKIKQYVLRYTEHLDKVYKEGKGIYFFGNNGVGKTTLACMILKECYTYRYTCKRITFMDYVSLYTRAWGDSEAKQEVEEEINKIKSREFLCIEEIGKENDTKVAVNVLEDLLRYREDNSLPTIICTNLSPKVIKERYGNSIYSLMKGNCVPIKVTGEDKRGCEEW